MPEVALSIRESVEDENNTAQKIADTLAGDASLATRLIQVANSPLFRTRNPIEDLQMAVTRLGMKMVRDLVIRLAMKQMFQATTDALDAHFRRAWSESVDVAAISRMLSSMARLNAEQAMLAGLIHNIGALPILVKAENDHEIFDDADELENLINEVQGKVGSMILSTWNFSQEMVDVVGNCNNFSRQHDGPADMVDVVQAAILHAGYADHVDWSQVHAFERLGLDSDVNVVNIEENKQQIEEIRHSLMC